MVDKTFRGLSIDKLNEVMQSDSVRQALEARAQRLLPATRAIAYQAGADEFAKALHVESGTRPGTEAKGGLKRSYARVIAEVTPQMKAADRGAKLSRRKILRRGGFNG